MSVTFYVTNGGLHQPGRVRRARVRRQDAAGSFDGRAGLLVRLIEVLSVLVVVLAVTTIDDRRVLVIDPRRGDLLHRPLERVLLVEDLLAGEGDPLLVAARVGLVVLRLVARWCHLLPRSVHTQTLVGPLLFQSLLVFPENSCDRTRHFQVYNAVYDNAVRRSSRMYFMIYVSMNG